MQLYSGEFLYGFMVQGIFKEGDSLQNEDGMHQRNHDHRGAVPKLKYDFMIYMATKFIKIIRGLYQHKFKKYEGHQSHYLTDSLTVKKWILNFCYVMDWPCRVLSEEELADFNESIR